MKNKIDTKEMQDKNGHKFLQRIFHLCFIVQEIQSQSMRNKEEKNNVIIFFFYHSYWDSSDSLVETYNQQMKKRIQGIGLVVFEPCHLLLY